MENGQQHQVVVHALANSGDGVGRVGDKIVFIPFAVPGDTLQIEITENKKSFAKARILNIVKASDQRREAPCPYFSRCGGCHWQNISEQDQRYWKKQNLIDALNRIGKLKVDSLVRNVEASPSNFGYRNRIQVQQDSIGTYYYERGSQRPVYIEKCLLASDSINQFLLSNSLIGKNGKFELAEMENGEVGVFRVNARGVSELGFRQVNREQNQWLKDRVAQTLQDHQLETVVDLYCGQGNWGMALEGHSPLKNYLGIDNNRTNIDFAKNRGLPSSEFLEGDAGDEYQKLSWTPDLILIDPPRAGCSDDLIQALIEKPSQWLIYISCHPATMARDLRKLVDGAWSIVEVAPVDMFPQTSHLECLTLLQSNKGAKTANY